MSSFPFAADISVSAGNQEAAEFQRSPVRGRPTVPWRVIPSHGSCLWHWVSHTVVYYITRLYTYMQLNGICMYYVSWREIDVIHV